MNKPIHSNIPKLKKWVTLTEAARYLFNLYKKEFSEIDILQCALDKRIKLSVFFPNGTHAKQGLFLEKNTLEESLGGLDGFKSKTKSWEIDEESIKALSILFEVKEIELENKVFIIDGIFDLPI